MRTSIHIIISLRMKLNKNKNPLKLYINDYFSITISFNRKHNDNHQYFVFTSNTHVSAVKTLMTTFDTVSIENMVLFQNTKYK